MELFRQINNEALDEDNKIRRQVVERLKKQVALFNQPYKAPAELSDVTLNNFQRFVINFDDTLNKTLNDAFGKEEKEDTGDLILNYNLLANYLDKINFNLLGASDKQNIMSILDELIPKIGKILSIIQEKKYSDADLVEKVFNNFKNHTYNVILEKERSYITSEAIKKSEKAKEIELDLSKLSPRERLLKRLQVIDDKIVRLSENIRYRTNSQILKIGDIAKELISKMENNIDKTGEVSNFLLKNEPIIDGLYNTVFKKVAPSVVQTQMREVKPEEAVDNFVVTPSLQQGAEEARLDRIPDYTYEPEIYTTTKKAQKELLKNRIREYEQDLVSIKEQLDRNEISKQEHKELKKIIEEYIVNTRQLIRNIKTAPFEE